MTLWARCLALCPPYPPPIVHHSRNARSLGPGNRRLPAPALCASHQRYRIGARLVIVTDPHPTPAWVESGRLGDLDRAGLPMLPPLGPGHHHVDAAAAAPGADEPACDFSQSLAQPYNPARSCNSSKLFAALQRNRRPGRAFLDQRRLTLRTAVFVHSASRDRVGADRWFTSPAISPVARLEAPTDGDAWA